MSAEEIFMCMLLGVTIKRTSAKAIPSKPKKVKAVGILAKSAMTPAAIGPIT